MNCTKGSDEGAKTRSTLRTGESKKCYSICAFLGIIFVAFFLSGCQEKGLKADVFETHGILWEQPLPVQSDLKPTQLLSKIDNSNIFFLPPIEELAKGMLVSGSVQNLANNLAKIEHRESYKEVVVLTSPEQANEVANTLEGVFPQAEVTVMTVKADTSERDAEVLALTLLSNLSDESFVVALTEFETTSPEPIAAFQQQFETTSLSGFDPYRADELPLKNTATVEVLMQYLLRKGDRQIEVIQPPPHAVVVYKEGEPTLSDDDTVYMVAFGDIMLGRMVRVRIDAHSLDYPFEKMDNDYLRVNDILIANLEGPVTQNAVRTNTGMSFGFFPDVVATLKKYHFDVLSQANNHTLDKGQKAWEESMTLLRSGGLIAFGYPKELNNDSVAKLYIRGQKFAFIGLEEVNFNIDDTKTVELIKQLNGEGYHVIPFLHWGIEYKNEPNNRQKDLAHKFIDAGAYAVIGAHPHVPESYETYQGRPIFYSLGNAVFDQDWSAETKEGLSVSLAMSNDHMDISFLPLKIDNSQVRLMNDDERKKFLERFANFGEHSDEEKEALKNGKLTLSFASNQQ